MARLEYLKRKNCLGDVNLGPCRFIIFQSIEPSFFFFFCKIKYELKYKDFVFFTSREPRGMVIESQNPK